MRVRVNVNVTVTVNADTVVTVVTAIVTANINCRHCHYHRHHRHRRHRRNLNRQHHTPTATSTMRDMQTALPDELLCSPHGRLAQTILRNCVHCGFCNATCPTHELLGNELDGPRGRIYQIKQLLEGDAPSRAMRRHLDRCLSCRSCETTCPSGVQYHSLLEIGQRTLDAQLPRTRIDRMRRALIVHAVSDARRFARLLKLARVVRKWLPKRWGARFAIPSHRPLHRPSMYAEQSAPAPMMRTMLGLSGCVQPALAPHTNFAARTVLARLGIRLVETENACCGGVAWHTRGVDAGRHAARGLIDRWHAQLNDVEAIVITASGCALTIKEYPKLFADDREYLPKAKRIAERVIDIAELLHDELPPEYRPSHLSNASNSSNVSNASNQSNQPRRVAFHPPCTLQHGLRAGGIIESLLTRVGYSVCALRDSHLCCGSAGTYSLLQPRIAARLRDNKWAAIRDARADVVCTANVGCQTHLQTATDAPVLHWIELLL